MRVVRVEVAGQRVFQYHVVGVAPHRDVVSAGREVPGQAHVRDHVVALAHLQRPAVLHRAQQHRTVTAGVGAGLVARQPDGVGPGRTAGIAGRGAAALVGHGVAHLDARAFDRLGRCDDAAGHQVGERIRIHVQGYGRDIVGIVRVLIHRAATVRLHDQEHIAAEADGYLDAAAFGGVLLARIQC